jgi:hypothetical protein
MMDIGKDLKEAYEQGYKDRDAELVRCKDCKYWHSNTEFCDTWSSMNIAQRTTSNAFCSYGERRET